MGFKSQAIQGQNQNHYVKNYCEGFIIEPMPVFSRLFPQNIVWASENGYKFMFPCSRNDFLMQWSNNTGCIYCLIKYYLDILPAGTWWGWREGLTITINTLRVPCSKNLYNPLPFYISDVILKGFILSLPCYVVYNLTNLHFINKGAAIACCE